MQAALTQITPFGYAYEWRYVEGLDHGTHASPSVGALFRRAPQAASHRPRAGLTAPACAGTAETALARRARQRQRVEPVPIPGTGAVSVGERARSSSGTEAPHHHRRSLRCRAFSTADPASVCAPLEGGVVSAPCFLTSGMSGVRPPSATPRTGLESLASLASRKGRSKQGRGWRNGLCPLWAQQRKLCARPQRGRICQDYVVCARGAASGALYRCRLHASVFGN